MALLKIYLRAFRDEPKMRSFALATLVSDTGIAASHWATLLLMTNMLETQRERASLMVPTLAVFLLGTIVSGPLADWYAPVSFQRLARWRWRLMVAKQLAGTALIAYLVVALSLRGPSIALAFPFVLGNAFLKTAFRPTEAAFFVDLLRHESIQLGAGGEVLHDERGEPLKYKTHLLSMSSLMGTITNVGTLVALVAGGLVMKAAGGNFALLFAINAAAHLAYVILVAFHCHPEKRGRDVSVFELLRDPLSPAEIGTMAKMRKGVFRPFVRSLSEGVSFLVKPEQRPLLLLLIGVVLMEAVTESYNGNMIVKHVLHGSDDAVRHSELVWQIGQTLFVVLIPLLTRWIGGLGRLYFIFMLIDGALITLAGRVAGAEAPLAILPFTAVLLADHALTNASQNLVSLAQNSASSAAMRGRIVGVFIFLVILADMAAEMLATVVSEKVGIPGMLERIGVLQIGVVLLLMVLGGRRVWRFGLHPDAVAAGAAE